MPAGRAAAGCEGRLRPAKNSSRLDPTSMKPENESGRHFLVGSPNFISAANEERSRHVLRLLSWQLGYDDGKLLQSCMCC